MADHRLPGRPALNALSFEPLSIDKPTGVGLMTSRWKVFRLDSTAAEQWSWDAYPAPSYRFDSHSGLFRVRYAATTVAGAAREVYLDTGKLIPADAATKHWCELEGELSVLDLRDEDTLDALGFDARISTSYEDHVQAACRALTDRVHDWWGTDVHGIAYSSRTTPTTSTNLAFFEQAPLTGTSRELRECGEVLEDLVLRGGFQVDFTF